MKKPIIFTAALAACILFTGCEQEVVHSNSALPGVFSVSEAKQVRFAPGNLQYTFPLSEGGKGTWSFATHQYDIIGTDNVTGGETNFNVMNHSPQVTHLPATTYGGRDGFWRDGNALSGKIDLFGWSGSTGSVKWGISTSTNDNDYSGSFADWGQNIDDGSIWRTLSEDEWYYLRYTRTNANNLIAVAKIELGDDKYSNGLILLPDDWHDIDGVAFRAGVSNDYSAADYYGDWQIFTIVQWQAMESAGAVFLPAAGYRDGVTVDGVLDFGGYWSATPDDDYPNCAGVFGMGPDIALDGVGRDSYHYGQAVRLVQDL